MSYQWRKVRDSEWWFLSEDAPDPVMRDGKLWAGERNGCVYPPSEVIEWGGQGCCVHLWSYVNGAEPADDRSEDVQYLHICDVEDTIDMLRAFEAVAVWKRPEWDERPTDGK